MGREPSRRGVYRGPHRLCSFGLCDRCRAERRRAWRQLVAIATTAGAFALVATVAGFFV